MSRRSILWWIVAAAPIPSFDRRRFADVVDNLISHAIKCTHAARRVRVHRIATLAEVIVHVADTGRSMTPDDLREVRLKARPTGNEKSAGLGLAIVKKIADLHGSRLRVTSEHGKGNVFTCGPPGPYRNYLFNRNRNRKHSYGRRKKSAGNPDQLPAG